LAQFIRQRYGVEIPPGAWPADALPQHLRPRVEVIGPDQKPLAASRDLGQLRQQFQKVKVQPIGDPPAWTRLAQQWERFGLTGWTFGDLPERIPLHGQDKPEEATAGSPSSARTAAPEPPGASRAPHSECAWPGLALEEDQVNLRLFRTRSAARQASRAGVRRLLELALQKDLAWLQKDLRGLSALEQLLAGMTSVEGLQAAAFEHLKNHLLPDEPFPVLTEANFRAAVEQARRRLPGLSLQLGDRLEGILKLRQEILRRYGPPPLPVTGHSRTLPDLKLLGVKPIAAPAKPNLVVSELESLLPARFLETVPFERLAELPRYLKALLTRAERAALNPVKDQERARQLAPYRQVLGRLQAEPPASLAGRRELEAFRWMVEEFKVSLFAQELGTALPVSARRLDQQVERMRLAED
jgi:ATP-dependent helicase HrpA